MSTGEKAEAFLCYVSFWPGDESLETTSILIMGTVQGHDVEAESAAQVPCVTCRRTLVGNVLRDGVREHGLSQAEEER